MKKLKKKKAEEVGASAGRPEGPTVARRESAKRSKRAIPQGQRGCEASEANKIF